MKGRLLLIALALVGVHAGAQSLIPAPLPAPKTIPDIHFGMQLLQGVAAMSADSAVESTMATYNSIGEVVKTNNNSLARYEKGSEVRGSPERIGYMIATLQSRELDKAHKSASEAASQAIVTACAIYAVTGYATVNSTRRKRGLAPVEYCANLPN